MKRIFSAIAALTLATGCTVETVHDDGPQPVSMKDSIRQTMSSNAKALRECQATATKKDEKFGRKLELDWVIDDKGNATDVKVDNKKSTIKDKEFRECVTKLVSATKFPAAQLSNTVKIDGYPLVFTPKE